MVVSFIFNYILKGKRISLTSPFTRYSFVFLVLVQIISALFSYRVLPSLGAVLTLLMLIIFYFIIINIFRNLFALKILTYTFIILNIINSIIMLYNSQSQKFRISAIFISPNELAFFLNISLVFIIMFYLKTKSTLKKFLFSILIISSISMIILTQARGGFIGFIIIFILYAIFSRNKSLIIATIIISIIVVIILVPDIYLTRIKDFQQKLTRKFQSGEEIHDIRLEITRIALDVFKKHPVFGVGPGNFLPYVREIHP
jgi:O-antigen ligase